MPEALAQVKRELGPEAVILGTRSTPAPGVGRLTGRNQVEITAAPAGTTGAPPRLAARPAPRRQHVATVRSPGLPDPPREPTPQPWALPAQARSYYEELVRNEVAEELAARLVRQAVEAAQQSDTGEADALREVVRRYIARMIPTSGGIELTDAAARRVALVGPPGGGKTTTLAKLAAHFKLRRRKRVAILSVDLHRLAAHEQLQRYADLIGVPMHTAQTVVQVKEALQRVASAEIVLIDTPGMSIAEQGRFARLAALLRAVRAHELHLVLPACTTASAQLRIAQSFAPLDVSRVVMTRLDDTVGLGVILNALDRLKWQLSYVTSGQKVPNDIEEACGQRMAELIFPPGGVVV
ncbi:MAG: AAA family ATPase [Planctomycetes bacterium]|nr:AAA family ATPase [Planctomycetota bacterium]